MSSSGVLIEPITNPEDFTGAFKAVANAFGHQTHDGVWIAFNPGWDTLEGAKAGAQRLADRFSSITNNRDGQPNTIFVKATVDGIIAGLAIWQQASVVQGYGDPPNENLRAGNFLEKLYPGNETEQRFLVQADKSLFGRRWEIIKESATASPPALFVMDLCAVDPQFQRKGIATKLVQWGLDEAKRRDLEVITEASTMGRKVYLKMGFKQEGGETVYDMDDEFKGRDLPSNVVLRTGKQ
ncbi:gnat family acetyltransferase [Fusarium austroafricanum]|uniref:Gnat family acetyltransferase n=1 Tax=Fusarium austroafricanum TaxID=2364996 RepID=A0A8H4KA66_9HYPO|nr:gnat family acetyltransferase [Fusarium austroafricanum]